MIGSMSSAALCVCLVVAAVPTTADEAPHTPPPAFFAGQYALIGQHAADGAAYAGTATITVDGEDGMVLTRTIDGETNREIGVFASLAPMVDATVLTLRRSDGQVVASCLWTIDLDNYARLTCLREPAGEGDAPGREALFPEH